MADLQRLSGRFQAKGGANISLSFCDTMSMFWRDLQDYRQKYPDSPEPAVAELLREVYIKSGKSLMVDGPVVCFFIVRHLHRFSVCLRKVHID